MECDISLFKLFEVRLLEKKRNILILEAYWIACFENKYLDTETENKYMLLLPNTLLF